MRPLQTTEVRYEPSPAEGRRIFFERKKGGNFPTVNIDPISKNL